MSYAVIYTRISSPSQSKIGNEYISLKAQEDICKDYCNKRSMVISKVYSEVKSGRYIRRQKDLMEIFETFKNIDLIVYDVSRLTRDSENGYRYMKLARARKITIHFVNDSLVSNSIRNLHEIRMRLSNATYESDLIGERIKKSNKHLLKFGWAFGSPVFGYKIRFLKNIRKKIKDPFEQKIIAFIIAAKKCECSVDQLNVLLKKILPNEKYPIEFLDKDGYAIDYFDRPNTLSFGEVANLLNSYNITRRGKKWTANSVNRVFNTNTCINKKCNDITDLLSRLSL